MKNVRNLLVAICLLFTFLLAGCSNGSFTIDDIIVPVNNYGVEIKPAFKDPNAAEEITYAYDSQDIKILNGKVFAFAADKEVIVTAKTSRYQTTFKVITKDFGLIKVEDVYAWINYPPSPVTVTFTKPEYEAEVTFSCDASKLNIEDGKVHGLVEGIHSVTAQTPYHKTVFRVKVSSVDMRGNRFDTSNFEAYKNTLLEKWDSDGSGSNTTLFIGDSFFDVRKFWQNFYREYDGYDVQCFGIGSTTSYDWEVFCNQIVTLKPKNIVVHIGTNNIYNDGDSAEQATEALQRLFIIYNAKLPQTRIYFFNIPRRLPNPGNELIVNQVNDAMKSWCAGKDWITFIDLGRFEDDMFNDGIHIKPQYYSLYREALWDAGIVISRK